MSNQSSSKGFVSNLAEIGRDLLVMEVSTIDSDSITGRKMPWFPHALIDILNKYVDWFVIVRNLKMGTILALPGPITPDLFVELSNKNEDSDTSITNGWKTIEQIRRTAKWIADDQLMQKINMKPLNHFEKGIALRIRRNCDQLKPIIVRFRAIESWQPYLLCEKGLQKTDQTQTDTGSATNWSKFREVDHGLTRTGISKALEKSSSKGGSTAVLDADTATRLRKIWELGTDRIIAQTLVHIDGDTITRFQRDVQEEDRTYYLGIHNQGVHTAVMQWKTLFDAFAKLIEGAASRIFGRNN